MLKYLTAGESHGKLLASIIDGIPAGVPISLEQIQTQLRRRKMGYGRGFRQNIETDAVEIASGIRGGSTLGSPICLLIENKDWENWKTIMDSQIPDPTGARKVTVPRPGHADLFGGLKYDHTDMRNVLERASARETTIRVAIGSIARIFLSMLGVEIFSRVTAIGTARDSSAWPEKITSEIASKIDESPVRCFNEAAAEKMVAFIEEQKKRGDTAGGVFEVIATGVPLGLGSYSQWMRRLEAPIAASFMSLNAVKGVEIGTGFYSASVAGSKAHDVYQLEKCKVAIATNHSGGITGGISTGQPIIVRAAMKPLSTLMNPLPSVNLKERVEEVAHVERSDVCAVPSAAVIGESLLALVLAEEVLIKFGGDSLNEIQVRFDQWKKRIQENVTFT